MKRESLKKTLIKVLLPFGLTLLLIFSKDFLLQYTVQNPGPANRVEIGATFIQMNAEALNLDWKAAYKEIINDLGINHVRIPVFWDQIESAPGIFNWSAIDWQMKEAAKANANVLLVVGHRVPRYPECYAPAWTQNFNDQEFKQSLLNMIEATVLHLKDYPALEAWQIENEPLAKILGKIWGGQTCREVAPFMTEEIKFVRSLDPTHPTVVTFATTPWMASQLRQTLKFDSDVIAVTLFNKLFFRSPVFNGYVEMFKLGFISPLRLAYQKAVAEHQGKQFWIAELQAEPWGPDGPYQFEHPEDAYLSMNPERLTETWTYAMQAGISKLYFWGAEWWLAERNKGNAVMLNAVKKLMVDRK
ncbi:MAG: cellulase family glycosylhydrolase [Myxacorys chilensis ATA2-1-KO14]|jgi:hypothetical protein|nr:cellulase family glycosylhydrolase [Myxacorys chilensis ATA2-1-KO14]